jgi:hypothetical protein
VESEQKKEGSSLPVKRLLMALIMTMLAMVLCGWC